MIKVKPWVRGPLELLRHAEGHFRSGGDFDKVIALISYDNAIEASITTYLNLHPDQRAGRTYPRTDVEKWMSNYHSKLDFFDLYLASENTEIHISRDEIIYYHNLRNELYHSGKAMVPSQADVEGARTSAIWLFSQLFQVDGNILLQEDVAPPPMTQEQQHGELSAQMGFLQSYIAYEKQLASKDPQVGDPGRRVTAGDLWRAFKIYNHNIPSSYESVVEQARMTRNAIVHGELVQLSEQELIELSTKLDEVTRFVAERTTKRTGGQNEEHQEPSDRAYWERHTSKSILAMVDEVLDILKASDSNLSLKYNKLYIGLARHGQADNFVSFGPRKGWLLLWIRLEHSRELQGKLNDVGLQVVTYDQRHGQYQIRLEEGDVQRYRPILSSMLKAAYTTARSKRGRGLIE